MAQTRANKATEVPTEDAPGTDVVKSRAFTDDDLRGITSFADAFALAEAEFGKVEDAAEELGDGFTLVKDLTPYIEVPVIILEWVFRPGDFGDTYASFRFVAQTKSGLFKGVYNDGGTGIKRMLESYTDRTGRMGGLAVRGGFRVSEYDTTKSGEPWKQGTHKPEEKAGRGKTWYLNV